ncbi:MAG TPA: SCO family protein [Afifellaceae bacterium]|nr:SCO family protein [Afifellaceae bacterium]
MKLKLSGCALGLALALATPWPALAHDAAHHAAQDTASDMANDTPAAEPTRVQLLDLALVDSEGREQLFRSEVLADRIVALNFIYTSCTTVCPVMSAIFGAVQEELGDRPDIRLVTISIDPATDLPPRLNRYAQQFGPGPGWTFLTGEKTRVTKVLAGLGAFAPEFEEHPSMVLIGDASRNVWRRFYGFASPDAIVAELERLAAARRDHAEQKEPTR